MLIEIGLNAIKWFSFTVILGPSSVGGGEMSSKATHTAKVPLGELKWVSVRLTQEFLYIKNES